MSLSLRADSAASHLILQIDDLPQTLKFFQDIPGFLLISSSSSHIELKDEYSGLKIYLIVSNILDAPSRGGIIPLTRLKSSFSSLHDSILSSSNYSWKSLDSDDNIVIIGGPNSLSVVISFFEPQGDDGASQFERYLKNFKKVDTKEAIEEIPVTSVTLPAPPLIPNLSIQVYGLNGFVNLTPNSRESLYIDTEAFTGHLLFLVRTKPLDQYYRHFFENNHRMYVIQIQGKFKRQVSSDELLMGLESNCSMGMMSKGIGRGMLKLLSNSGSFRHSLGDSKNPSAYVAASLFSSVDRMCITLAGEKPPPIYSEFPESKDMKSRRKMKSLSFDTSHTYSFTIKGKYIDFCEWSTCGFRMMNPNHLSTFIGSSPLRLVAYTEQKSKSVEDSAMQSRRRPGLSYFLEIEIRSQFVTSSFSVIQNSDSESEGEEIDPPTDDQEPSSLAKSDLDNPKISVEELIRSDRVLSVRLAAIPETIGETPQMKRPFSSPSRSNSYITRTNVNHSNEVNSTTFTDTYLMTIPSTDDKPDEGVESLSFDTIYPQRRSMKLVSIPLERINMEWIIEDSNYCPAVIEINDYRRGRSRRVAYIVTRPNSPSRLRSYMQLAQFIPLLMMDDAESRCGRFSETEIRRRQLAISLKKVSLLAQSDGKIESIWDSIFANPNDLDENFLRKVANPRNRTHGGRGIEDLSARTNSEDHLFDQSGRSPSPTLHTFLSSSPLAVRMEGLVAVCTGRRSWSEEWAILTGKYFTIPNPQTAKHLRIPSVILVGQIRSVNILNSNEKPFQNYEFFTIGTAARVYYFCVKNEYILSQWIEALLQSQLPPSLAPSSRPGIALEPKGKSSAELNRSPLTMMGDNMPEEPEACIINAGSFSSSYARVLNHRCVYFHASFPPHSPRFALILSQQILRQILNISKNTNSKNSVNPDVTDWIDFSEKVSMLQSITLEELTKHDLIAFFLNVYHTLLLHAYIVVGVPASGIDWRTLKGSVSYEIAGDIMTLRDIDEVILGNVSNKVVLFNFLRIQLSQSEASKQIESKKPKQLDPTLMFPSSRLYFGELWDYSIPMAHVAVKDVLNTNHCDWRVALCITNGTADLSKHIYIYDGKILNRQLDKRCEEILSKRVRIDTSPPSILTNTPSISLPKSLSSLIPPPSSSNGRVSPGPDSKNTDDPRHWLSGLLKYLQSDNRRSIEQIFQTSHKIYIYFDIPDYSSFKFLHLKVDDEFDQMIPNEQMDDKNQHFSKKFDDVDHQRLQHARHSLATLHKSESTTVSIEHDRSISLDSGHGGSPLKKNELSFSSSLQSKLLNTQRNLFSEENILDEEMTSRPPPLPSSTSSSPRTSRPNYRQSIEDLRHSLQVNPSKQKEKKKSIFGWRNNS